MGRATICDKCRKILRCAPSARISLDAYYNGTAKYELCEDCKKKLLAWLCEEDARQVNTDYKRDGGYLT